LQIGKVVSGHQPNYLPWLGFFDKMLLCDAFIIEDNVQFEEQGFQNRTRIKTANGVRWLTVPIEHAGKALPINEITIANEAKQDWANDHWLALKFSYCRAPYWKKYSGFFEQTFSQRWVKLVDLNMHLIEGLMKFLNIEKPLVMASSLGVSGRKSELLLAQCKALGASTLLSGVGARSYLDVQRFEKEGVRVVFQDFRYPVYPQLAGEFVPDLSVVDYLFWVGGKPWRSEDMVLKESIS
jgi:hypothetical protein